MKTIQLLLVSALLAIGTSAFAAGNHDHGHEHKPLHGGVVVEASDMGFELVAKADQSACMCATMASRPACKAPAPS